MSKYTDVKNARDGIWMNYQDSMTAKLCPIHIKYGKFMGCAKCFEEKLADLIGKEKANKYHLLVKEIRMLEDSMTIAEDEG